MSKEREANLATSKEVRERLEKLYSAIEKGYQDQFDRAEQIKENWKMYRTELSDRQLFWGRNQLYAPFVYDALTARATRFTNQLFPQNDRHIEVISSDGTMPRAAVALAEHHIKYARLRELMPALIIAGDCEGQYNIYVDWQESRRHVVRRTQKDVEAEEGLVAGTVEDVEAESVSYSGPRVEIIPDTDLIILPATGATLDEVIDGGGSVTIIRRWNETKIKRLIENEEIDKTAGQELLAKLDKNEGAQKIDLEKDAVKAAGVRSDGRGRWALVFETWTELKTEDGFRRCKVLFGGDKLILSAKRNPFWCDKLPLLSVPVKRQPGSIKGIPPVEAVSDLQYYANDVLNEVADATNYSLIPILKRDPEAATAPLVLAPGAVWDVAPGQVESLAFPPLWQQGFEILTNLQTKIMQTLSVSPAMLTTGPNKLRKNQAEIAQEQQVELITTADAAVVLEEGILTPLVELIMDLDYQYRDESLLARAYGEMGMMAALEAVAPLQMGARYQFNWIGTEVTRSAQMIQQKIAAINMLRGFPSAMYPDYTLDAQPIIVDLVESTFGSRQGRLVLKDMRSQLSVDPDKENDMMEEGLELEPHPSDKDEQHIPAHNKSLMQNGDPFHVKQIHIQKHLKQMHDKIQAIKQMQSGPQGPGGQGGPPGAPGAPGLPPPGAQPMTPQGAQRPPGLIPDDQLHDPTAMPRKMG